MAWTDQRDVRLARIIEGEIDALYRVALRLTGAIVVAEDLVQETCLRAWRAQRSVRDRPEVRDWLFRILRNAWIDTLRKSQRAPVLVELTSDIEPRAAPDAPPPPIDVADRDQLEQCLDREVIQALDDLTDEERLTMLLQAFADINYHEIAETLECPLGTVMSRLHRARAKLRTRLADYARLAGVIQSRPAESGEGDAINHGNA
ncbi:MAG TPA: sigma-70 family RNA polymerase sigma factor [Opitutaceae bacterium]